MTATKIGAINRYIGKSTDIMPTEGVPVGSEFFATDNKATYLFDGVAWYSDGNAGTPLSTPSSSESPSNSPSSSPSKSPSNSPSVSPSASPSASPST